MPKQTPSSHADQMRIVAFVLLVLVVLVAFLATFSLRAPLWGVDDSVIAQPVGLNRVFEGGLSEFADLLLAMAAATAAYLGCLALLCIQAHIP